jgi:hypothetical protein
MHTVESNAQDKCLASWHSRRVLPVRRGDVMRRIDDRSQRRSNKRMHTVESNAQDIDDWGCASTLDVSNMAEVITLSGKLFALLRLLLTSNVLAHPQSSMSWALLSTVCMCPLSTPLLAK